MAIGYSSCIRAGPHVVHMMLYGNCHDANALALASRVNGREAYVVYKSYLLIGLDVKDTPI